MQQPRARDAGPVDDDADDLAFGCGDAAIDRMRRGGRRRVDTDQPEISGQRLQDRGIEGRVRAIVDDDDLVVGGVDVALVGGGEREQRARRLAGDVVDHDHD